MAEIRSDANSSERDMIAPSAKKPRTPRKKKPAGVLGIPEIAFMPPIEEDQTEPEPKPRKPRKPKAPAVTTAEPVYDLPSFLDEATPGETLSGLSLPAFVPPDEEPRPKPKRAETTKASPTTSYPPSPSGQFKRATNPRIPAVDPGQTIPPASQNGDTGVNLPMITLPALPAPMPQRNTQPRHPAITAYRETGEHAALTIVPGPPSQKIYRALPPPLRERARGRIQRLIMVAAFVVALIAMMTFVPAAHGASGQIANWITGTNAFAYPTPTPTFTPTPVIYPLGPRVSGGNNFLCTALPFARLAQYRMRELGRNPWYVSVMLAQWGVEQGFTMPGYTGYNWGNVSAISGYPSVGGLNVVGSPGAFAYAYTTLQGLDEYLIFVQMHYYSGVAEAWPNGPDAQAIAIGDSPWDAAHYNSTGQNGSKILSVMKNYNTYRFDDPKYEC